MRRSIALSLYAKYEATAGRWNRGKQLARLSNKTHLASPLQLTNKDQRVNTTGLIGRNVPVRNDFKFLNFVADIPINLMLLLHIFEEHIL